MDSWQNCDSCSGPNGQGPHIPHLLTQDQTAPSLDGNSSEFWIGGTIPYSSVLWWRQLGAQPTASNFVYDLYFYVTNSNSPQALEFDVNQSVNGKKFIFGTECNYKATKQWDVWNNATKHWDPTGVTCTPPTAYTWHHVIWNFQRTSDGQAAFIAVTFDGQTSYVNRSSFPKNSGTRELNVAFQQDINSHADNYNTWLDEVTLYYW